MTPQTRRLAHAYAVRALRRLGRDLASGDWRPGAEPITVPEATAVMGRAFLTVMDLGIARVLEALDERLAGFLGG